jgi:DNA repair protein RecN (Recombination protein N)
VAQLREAEIVLREASNELGHYHRQLHLDPEHLATVEQRLSQWHDTARKLKVPPEALHSTWQTLKTSLQELQLAGNLEALQAALNSAEQHYTQAAQTLSAKRHTAAQALSQVVTNSMQQLNMRGGVFEVVLQTTQPSAHGNNTVEFRAAGHPGVPAQPIGKVASGGELARLSLAITVNTVQGSTLPTLLFDEVDSGIGGAVAETVGHLPQVAACGHQHLRVFKHIENDQTRSGIVPVEGQARVEELARMLGGKTIGPATLSAAKELLEQGRG